MFEEVRATPFECPICYESFGRKENIPVTLTCGHNICACHLEINKLTKCPLCRLEISKEFHRQFKRNIAFHEGAMLYDKLHQKYVDLRAKQKSNSLYEIEEMSPTKQIISIEAGIGLPKMNVKSFSLGNNTLPTSQMVQNSSVSSISQSGGPINSIFPYSELRNGCPPGIITSRKEEYLDANEFITVFGISKTAFISLPLWKRNQLKKEKGLF